MRILMFGWEFPPASSGGLGTACYGLTKGLSGRGADITFVLPKRYNGVDASHLNIISAEDERLRNVKIRAINSSLQGYVDMNSYQAEIKSHMKQAARSKSSIYGNNLLDEVHRYSEKARIIAKEENFDVIHVHDWMTFDAGINAKKEMGKPLVAHVHATEFDRTGGNPNQKIYNIERRGMHFADKIIAVSEFTKQKIISHYGIPESKVAVVHNAVEFSGNGMHQNPNQVNKFNAETAADWEKIVLFLGRVTLQKGPDYFLYAAKKVLELDPRVKFIMAGSGDMEPFIIEKAAQLGISRNVLFTGYLTGDDVDSAYKMASLYVMPSVSEPFGITPLEALKNGVPVLISKQSGVSEVLTNCLKVDFWDVNDMANKMMAALNYKTLHSELRQNGCEEIKKFSWDVPAQKCMDIYHELVNARAPGQAEAR